MKQILLSLFLYGIVNCGTLDNTYLPPQNSQSSSGSQFFQPPVVIDGRSNVLSSQPILLGASSKKFSPYYSPPIESYPFVRRPVNVFQADDIFSPIFQRYEQQYYPNQYPYYRYTDQYSRGAGYVQNFGLSKQYQENFNIPPSTTYGVPYSSQDIRKQHGDALNIINADISQKKVQGFSQVPFRSQNSWTVRNDDGYKY